MPPSEGTVYALLVGINDYDPNVANPLRGCVNDIRHVGEFLRARLAGRLCERVLLDADATRAAVIDAFRTHLGQAGEGDVALFWYSGHGSEEPVPEELAHLEPNGYLQTLVCVDSRTAAVPDLTDKDLNVLIGRVAARGAHVVVVADCCNSGGNTREVNVADRGIARAAVAPALASFTAEVQALARGAEVDGHVPVPHVALAACRSSEQAKEQPIDGQIRGVFSASLLAGLARLGAGATYRDLLVAAKCQVQNRAGAQVPQLHPVDAGGLADQPFLGGRVTRPAAAFVLRQGRDGWEVDAGRCHGIPELVPGDPVLLAAQDAGAGTGLVRVTDVRPERSLVQVEGWEPDPARQYPVVLAGLPLPPAAVVLGGREDDDNAAVLRVGHALATAGPGGGPSPHVRVVAPEAPAVGLRLRVAAVTTTGGGRVFRILRGDGSVATADVAGHTEQSAAIVAARLEHIARWTHIKDLDNPASALAGAVRIEIVEARPGDTVFPWDRPALYADKHGDVHREYTRTAAGWEPPKIFIRLRNVSGRRLYCVLLNLTDRFRVHPLLFSGAFVEEQAAAWEGRPIPVKLPPGRAVAADGQVRDWIKLVVADEEFGSLAFTLPRLDEPPTRAADPIRPRGVVDRLGLRAISRDVGDDDVTAAGDWSTSIVSLLTTV